MLEGSGSGSIPLTSGSEWPKNMWIRIRNTGNTYAPKNWLQNTVAMQKGFLWDVTLPPRAGTVRTKVCEGPNIVQGKKDGIP